MRERMYEDKDTKNNKCTQTSSTHRHYTHAMMDKTIAEIFQIVSNVSPDECPPST